MNGPATGSTGRYRIVATPENSGHALGLEGHHTLAPSLIALAVEDAAHDAIVENLAEGQSSVGTVLDLTYHAPVPVGSVLEATATLDRVDGRKLVFSVRGTCEGTVAVDGTHERMLIDLERFLARLKTA